MGKLPLFLVAFTLLLFMNILHQLAYGARTFGNPTPSRSRRHRRHHYNHHKLAFMMRNALNVTQPSTPQVTGTTNQHLSFPKPIGLFPSIDGIPIPKSNPLIFPTQTIDIPNSLTSFFPPRNALEFREVMTIYEDLFNGPSSGALLGKAQGFCVASSEDRSSHMVALNTYFADGADDLRVRDGLRFFGVYRNEVPEYHVAVINSTGKYARANGYGTIKVVDASNEEQGLNKLFLFNVYRN